LVAWAVGVARAVGGVGCWGGAGCRYRAVDEREFQPSSSELL
jgi:hypothetical protein